MIKGGAVVQWAGWKDQMIDRLTEDRPNDTDNRWAVSAGSVIFYEDLRVDSLRRGSAVG